MENKVNFAVCQDMQDSQVICGAYADHTVDMPYGIPPMPLCNRHYPKYEALGDDGLKEIVDHHLNLMAMEAITDPQELIEYLKIIADSEGDDEFGV